MKDDSNSSREGKQISLASIRTNGGTQPRADINRDTVAEYAADIKAGATLPPVDVFHDGHNHWLSHGFHRLEAHRYAGRDTINAIIHQGSQQDAQWFSYAANLDQDRVGLRRTNADKERAIRAALAHPKGTTLSDSEIAEHVGVDHKTVARQRAVILGNSQDAPATRTVNRGGTTYKMDVTKIGKKTAPTNVDIEEGVIGDDDPATPVDQLGRDLPDDKEIIAAFSNRPLFEALMRDVSALKASFKSLATLPGGKRIDGALTKRFDADVKNLHATIRFAMPYALCLYCGGARCVKCSNLGWMLEEVYKREDTEQKLRQGRQT